MAPDQGLDQKIKQGMEAKLVGQKLPDVPLQRLDCDMKSPVELKPSELFSGKLAVLIGVPGAFTPAHVPAYLKHVGSGGELGKAGVDYVAVTAVNDAYVMDAWSKDLGTANKVDLLADPDAAFAKALGAASEGDMKFKGPRSRRYSAILQNGMIQAFNMEDDPNNLDLSTVEVALGQIEALKRAGAIQAK